ncbi:MAG: tRNA 2-thiouridine(34) synthase MnmA [Actinobacteria bacterium]|nr:tRNA 2-thiouridine(34) synthase MnmA [Actinomycetota bacterium]
MMEKSTPLKVLAALSGGVDSAVAAARCVDAGHDVTAVHLALSETPEARRSGARGCCSLEDSRDARRVADSLGIPYYVWDVAERFTEEVIEDFIAEYAAGRTPNPCLRCNERIKFAAVLERALALGFDAVCTGHYAQVRTGGAGYELHRAVDPAKDQSYVLAVLTQDQLAHCMFPLGDSTKDQVRAEASARGIQVASKPDSHDICFIPNGDTKAWLSARIGVRSGEIRDAETGDVIGEHEGAHAYTVGQRRGLGLDVSAPDRARRYVVGVDTGTNTVLVGPPTLLDVDHISAERPVWCGPTVTVGAEVSVQVRAHGEVILARVAEITSAGVVSVKLVEPLRGVAPGQALVLYDGTRVIGSATITGSRRERT